VSEEFTDAERIDWLREQFKTNTIYMSGQHPYAPTGYRLRHLHGPTFRAALDAAMLENGWRPTRSGTELPPMPPAGTGPHPRTAK
jgi:hypothetical protein